MVRRLFWFLAAAAALECVWLSVRVFAARLGERAGDSDFDSSAIVAGAASSGAKVAFLCRDGESIGSCQRASLIGLDWALLPRVATPLPSESVSDWDGDVVVEVRSDVDDGEMSGWGFGCVATNGLSALYRRTEASAAPVTPAAVSREPSRLTFGSSASVVLVVVLLAGLWLWFGGLTPPGGVRLLAALGICAVLLAVALPGGLNAPNGLGVYGGKAKLICLLHGLPDGFWTAPEYAVFQPSYPPLMTLAALLSFLVGGVSDRALQLFVPAVAAILFLELTRFAPACGRRRWLVLSVVSLFLLSPETVRLARGFYAEPLAMLFIACGWNALLDGRPRRGWLALGLSALVRPEGLVIAGISWFVWIFGVSVRRGWRATALSAALALSPGIAWQLAMRFLGARLYDYDLLHLPEFECFVDARVQLVRAMVGDFALNGGVFLFSALLVALSFAGVPGRPAGEGSGAPSARRTVTAAVLVTALSLLAGAVLISFSTCPDREWLYEMTLPRYALLCVLPMLLSGTRFAGAEESLLPRKRG